MATLVSFHAHPDDETIATGGTLAKAAADGHRVVLVVATKGELGEVPDGMLALGETLAERRAAETERASDILGVHRLGFLGYRDSGMAGEASNEDPEAFCNAPVDIAAKELVAILEEESADVLTSYDSNGGYGHPDHIAVHKVAARAAELYGRATLVEATMNRDHFKRLVIGARDQGLDLDLPEPASFDNFGVPEAEIAVEVDVSDFIDVKRAAMAAHATQISETSIFLSLPDFAFAATWGAEWYVRPGDRTKGNSVFAG